MSSGWQDALGTLARERELAESGAGLLKAYARDDAAAMARGQELYAKAKAASDELVERLLVAVREGDDPGTSPSLRTATSEEVQRRLAFTRHVEGYLPRAEEGRRSVAAAGWLALLEPAKVAGEVVRALVEGAVKVWTTWREGRELDRQAIATRLAAQRWRAFVDVPEAA
jgi:hypothetical protein